MYRAFGKRLADVLIAALLLIALAPLLGLTAGLVWLCLGSPLLFRQRRAGLLGKPFTIVKFRTMTEARDTNGMLRPDVDRLTRFGRFLRRASVDELPQLWNVLTGDMSLVGPRPLFVEYLDRYTPPQRRRHDVRPGITGLAQVRGRSALRFSERLRHDLEYVEGYSFPMDCRIVAMTIYLVAFGKLFEGAGQDVAVVDDVGLHPDSPAYMRAPASGDEGDDGAGSPRVAARRHAGSKQRAGARVPDVAVPGNHAASAPRNGGAPGTGTRGAELR